MARDTVAISAVLSLTTSDQPFDDGTDVLVLPVGGIAGARERILGNVNIETNGTTDDVTITVLAGYKVTSGTADAGSATNTLDLATAGGTPIATADLTDDSLNDMYAIIDGGAAQGDFRKITDFDGTTNDRITVDSNWSTTTDNTSQYSIYSLAKVDGGVVDVSVDDPLTFPIDVEGPEVVVVLAKVGGSTDTVKASLTHEGDGVAA